MTETLPVDARFGVVRSVSYGLFGPPDRFVPQARELGAGLIRIYSYWSQVEPEPGRFTFDAIDAFLEQLDGSEEVWVTVCSSSPWATRESATFLPPSPANDPDDYARFVRKLVRHCGGRVRYWQCDNEPSNVGLTWSGTVEEYVAQLAAFARAVREADLDALVVLGGAPYGMPAASGDSPERRFYEVLLRDGRGSFDLFDLHLYQEAERIPGDVETVRSMLRESGNDVPIVAGEYNAPWPNLFPRAVAAMQEAMEAVFTSPMEGEDAQRAAIARLYDRMPDLPPELQMFMAGCPEELDAKRDRINCREIVMRNVLALASGIHGTACWNLAPDIPNYTDHLSVMDLLFGKLPLMEFEGTELRPRAPATAFSLVAEHLGGATTVERMDQRGRPDLRVFEVRRDGRGPLLVAWNNLDPFTGEDEPAIALDLPWDSERAQVVDALGEASSIQVRNGRVTLPVSVTPILAWTGTPERERTAQLSVGMPGSASG